MKRSTIIRLAVIVVVAGAVIVVMNMLGLFLPAYADDIDRFMESRREAMNVPGLAVGIVDADGLVWEGYYGTLDGSRSVSEDTLFMIASISKTVVATAAMQLWEQGAFDLDDDINEYLDFEVVNPNYPEAAITFRQLMTHRSSISDGNQYLEMCTIEDGGGDSTWALGDFLEAYLVPGGEYYSADSYLDDAPGERYDYSNYGVALLAHLVEIMSGEDFAATCHDHIFAPLGMDHSYYLLSEIPDRETEIAVPFQRGEALPHYGFPDYPVGSLRTTVSDLSKFAVFYLDPAGSDADILQPETVELMFGEYGEATGMGQNKMGLIWKHLNWVYLNATGHTGADPGVSTSLLLYPDDGVATIVFMNARPRSYFALRDVHSRLRDEGLRLAASD